MHFQARVSFLSARAVLEIAITRKYVPCMSHARFEKIKKKQICDFFTVYGGIFKEVVSLATVHICQASLETQITKEET